MSSAKEQISVGAMPGELKEKTTKVSEPGNSNNYKGFVAGVFSGIAKLSGK